MYNNIIHITIKQQHNTKLQ